MKTLIIIQARQNSRRFPNKVLNIMNGKPVIQYLIDFVKSMPFDFVFAIPKNYGNEMLKDYLKVRGCKVFEGLNEDVLDRFYKCAKKYKADTIIRLCADTPFLNPRDIYLNLTIHDESGIFSYGNGVYVFSFQELEEAWKNASSKEAREHIIPYMMKCIDYPEDLKRWEKPCGGDFGQRISNRSRS